MTDRDIGECLMQPLCLFGHFAAIALCNALRREELAKAEAQKKQFYRDVVYAVTNGKLELCEPGDVEEYWLDPVDAIPILQEGDIRHVRQMVQDVCEAAGMDGQRIYDLALCASEAATNALKHGEGGLAAIARKGETIRVRIEDCGAGIDPATLPKATLMKGFSTRASMGLGFTIMHELADKIYLSSAPCGTVVIIEMGVTQPELASLPIALLSWEE
jgi:anti-sigma regulatory factor (Ser/Thr protein kinase)